jgi:hypothetical protein
MGVMKSMMRERRVSSEGAPIQCNTLFLRIVVVVEDILVRWVY